MVLSGVALLVSAYLFVMVSALQAVTVVTLWNARRLTVREWSGLAGIVVGIGALAMIMGYGRILSATTTMRAAGYGALSWNPATLVLPPRGYWDSTDDLVRIVTTDQVEGESYVGFGVLLIVATCLVSRFGQVKDAVRRHWLFVAALLMFTAYALSNRISVGGYRILEVPLPQPIYELASFFRASGRFIWVPIYALTLLSFAALIKWVPRRVVVPVILIACLLQFWEVRTTILDNRPVIALPSPDLLDVAAFDGWLNGHRRMFQFPSWSCEPARTTEASFREMQIQLLAARMGVPSNSVYTSRQLKDCAAEAAWADTAELRGGVLYVLNKSQVDRSGALAALAGSAACIDAGWGLVCSRRSLAPR
jgi:hypothetical protein